MKIKAVCQIIGHMWTYGHMRTHVMKKSESLSDRFLLGVSEFLMMITICGQMIISNDASGFDQKSSQKSLKNEDL